MLTLESTKIATRIAASLVVLALGVTAALLMKSARAFRNLPTTIADNQTSSQKAEKGLARPTESRSNAAEDKTSVEELSAVPSKRDSPSWFSFVDDQFGWFADDLSLWKSTDGGQTWKLLLSNDDIRDVFFSNRQVGWIERGSGVYRTEDGGEKWTRISTSLEYPKGMIGGMYFLNDGQTGWVVGGIYKPVSAKRFHEEALAGYLVRDRTEEGGHAFLYQRILRSNDGGNTWRRQSLPDEVGEIFSLNFADDIRGVALGGTDVFFTKNGGKAWEQAVFKQGCVDPEFIKFPDSMPRAAAFAENNAWLSYDNGRVLKSVDGGESWCDLLRPEEVWRPGEQGAFFRQLYFLDSLKGWGLQDNGKLFKTDDGGRVWSPIDLNGERIWGVRFFKDHALLVTKEKILKVTY